MTDLFRWAGYGDADTPFDHEATAFNPLFVYGTDSGEPCLVYTPAGSQTFMGRSPLGAPASLSVRMGLKLSGYPSSSVPIIAPLTTGGTSAWRIRLSSTGTLIIDNPANTATGTTAAIPLNTRVLVKILATATTVKVRIYDAIRGGALIGSETTGTSTFGLVDNWRQGQAAASPIVPPYRISHLLVTDDTTWVADPEVPDAVSAGLRYGIIGDSLTAMSGANGEYIRQALLAAGIPPRNVYLWGVGGKRIAVADLTGKTSAQNITDAQNVLGTISHWIVALGTNDRPQNDATVNAAIDTILTAIGTGPKVTWIGLTSKGSASTDDIRVNGLVQAKLTARGNAVFADWNARIRSVDGGDVNSPLWISSDTTHLSALGYSTQRAPFYVEQLIAPIAGSGNAVLPGLQAAGIGTRTIPVFSGTAAAVLPALQASGVGTHTVPVFSGTGAAVLPALQAVGLGTGVAPVFVAVGTLTLPPLGAAGVGVVITPAVVTGSGVVTLPALTAAGTGTSTAPTSTGAGALVLPALVASGSGEAGGPYSGIGALVLPALVAAGVGTIPSSEQPYVPNPFESRSWPSRAPGSERPYRIA